MTQLDDDSVSAGCVAITYQCVDEPRANVRCYLLSLLQIVFETRILQCSAYSCVLLTSERRSVKIIHMYFKHYYALTKVIKSFNVIFQNMKSPYSSSVGKVICYMYSGPENLEKSRQKKSSNQINQFFP